MLNFLTLTFLQQVFIIGQKRCFQLLVYKLSLITVEFYLFKHVLLNKICIRILSDLDPNPNGLIGFGSFKTFGSFRIRIWIRIRIPNTGYRWRRKIKDIAKVKLCVYLALHDLEKDVDEADGLSLQEHVHLLHHQVLEQEKCIINLSCASKSL